MSARGLLIAIEGIDGAGKTTQVELLRMALERAGRSVIASKEPTNGPWGTLLRRSAQTGRLSPEEELEMFIRDRTEHVEQLIRPHLETGDIVILDRYFYSTIAYQGARGADTEAVRERMHALFPIPDAVFILDIDPAAGIHRIAHNRGEEPNQFENYEGLAAARAIFRRMCGGHIHHIDATSTVDEIHKRILNSLPSAPQ